MAINATGTSHDFIIHPGEIIADVLNERGITQVELAKRTGVSGAYVSNIVAGKKNISAKYAMALEYALNVPASFWLNLQAGYDSKILAAEATESITEGERSACADLKEITKYLRSIGKMPVGQKIDDVVLSLRKALNVSSLENLEHIPTAGAFRISEKSRVNPTVLGAWLQLCRTTSNENDLDTVFDASKIDALIAEIKGIMCNAKLNPQTELPAVLGKYGISFAIVRNFKGAPVQGYISSNRDGTYHIALTIRGAWADIFWFSLFHELAHILNGDVVKSSYFMDLSDTIQNSREHLADSKAADMLLNTDAYKTFTKVGDFGIVAIIEFARTQCVPPFIVIGRLQKEGLVRYNRFLDYKSKYKWSS